MFLEHHTITLPEGIHVLKRYNESASPSEPDGWMGNTDFVEFTLKNPTTVAPKETVRRRNVLRTGSERIVIVNTIGSDYAKPWIDAQLVLPNGARFRGRRGDPSPCILLKKESLRKK